MAGKLCTCVQLKNSISKGRKYFNNKNKSLLYNKPEKGRESYTRVSR